MRRVVAGLIMAGVLAAGCGDGDLFVRANQFSADPSIPSLEDSKGFDAFLIYAIVSSPQVDDGEVFIIFLNGTTLVGDLDRLSGYFDWTYTFPGASDLATLHQYGSLTFDATGLVSASYSEEAEYRDETDKSYNLAMSITGNGNFVVLSGHDEQDAVIESSVVIALGDRIDVTDIVELDDVYRVEVNTSYSDNRFQDPEIRQDAVRDDLTTPGAIPDREAFFEINWDHSGFGFEYQHYDGGVEARSEVQFYDDGSAQRRLTYEDPVTNVSPDGEGLFSFNPDASGDGYYVEMFDDGSVMRADYLYRSTYFDDVFWTYDIAGNPIDVDVDGEIYYQPDRSGNGLYTRYEPVGPVELCDYLFDTSGTITDMDCTDPSKAMTPPDFGREALGITPVQTGPAAVTAP